MTTKEQEFIEWLYEKELEFLYGGNIDIAGEYSLIRQKYREINNIEPPNFEE